MHYFASPNKPTHRRLATILTIVAALLASACSSGSSPDTTNTAAAVSSNEAPATSAVTSSAVPSSTTEAPLNTTLSQRAPAAESLDWVVALLNNPDPEPADIEERFSPDFLAAVPVTQLLGLIPQLNAEATGPWSITESDVDEFTAMALIEAEGSTPFSVQLRVDAAAPHKIEELRFQPAEPAEQFDTLVALEAAIDAFASTSRIGLYNVTSGECVAEHERNAAEVMPVGSVFKLWILVELAQQVENGEASWDEIFPVQNRYKASPDGEIYNMDEGTEVTLLRYAELMISISDNGATDHLLHRLGRERVEAAMTPSGVADPSLNVPFLSASDLFMIKFSPDGPSSDDYRSADFQGRRAMLDAMVDESTPWVDDPAVFPTVNADGVPIDQPRDHDLEWFATPADVCRTHLYLAELAERPGLEQVASILSINPTAGMPFERSEWNDLRFKGGSEQGIVAVAWWMERADGELFVLAGGIENPEAALSSVVGVGLLQQYANFTG